MDRGQLQELIQRELDGELSLTERAELSRLLLQDPAARRLHHEFWRMDQLLREIPAVEPPTGLRAAVLAGRGQSSRLADAGRREDRWPLYRLAAAILGGLLIVGIADLLLDADSPGARLQGSLAASGNPGTSDLAGSRDRLTLRAEGAEASAVLKRDGQKMSLELTIATEIPCELVARIDPGMTTLAGHGGGTQVNAAGDQVTVPLAIGSQALSLNFLGAAPIRLQLRSGGRLLAEGALAASDP